MLEDNNLGIIGVQVFELLPDSLNVSIVFSRELYGSNNTSVAYFLAQHNPRISQVCNEKGLLVYNSH